MYGTRPKLRRTEFWTYSLNQIQRDSWSTVSSNSRQISGFGRWVFLQTFSSLSWLPIYTRSVTDTKLIFKLLTSLLKSVNILNTSRKDWVSMETRITFERILLTKISLFLIQCHKWRVFLIHLRFVTFLCRSQTQKYVFFVCEIVFRRYFYVTRYTIYV